MLQAERSRQEAGKADQQYCRVMTILTLSLVKRLDVLAQRQTVNRSILIRQACEAMLREEVEKEAA